MNEQATGRRSRDSTDRWNLWFTRLTQLTGLGVGVHEAVLTGSDRFGVLAFSAAMILGPQGLRLMLRGARGLNGEEPR